MTLEAATAEVGEAEALGRWRQICQPVKRASRVV
jgi:hypothetical protein